MTHWLHFIGDNYKDDYRFILEARRNGITRNVPAQTARGFHYGDTVQLLRWKRGGKLVYAFAEMVVNQVTLPKELSDKVAEALKDRISIHYDPSPLHIDRDCGSYDICGTFTVEGDIDIPDIIKAAQEISKDEKFRCMVGGRLLKVYDTPIKFPGVKFTRGFQKGNYRDHIEDVKQIVGIENYRRK